MTVMTQFRSRPWVAVIAWLVIQLTLTTLPGSMLPSGPPGLSLDKVGHFGLYFVLAFLVSRAWLAGGRRPELLALLWVALGIYAALDELHQLVIPGRSADIMDWLTDLAGGAAGFVLGPVIMRTRWAGRLLR